MQCWSKTAASKPVARDYVGPRPLTTITPPSGITNQDWFLKLLDEEGYRNYLTNDIRNDEEMDKLAKYNGLKDKWDKIKKNQSNDIPPTTKGNNFINLVGGNKTKHNLYQSST